MRHSSALLTIYWDSEVILGEKLEKFVKFL